MASCVELTEPSSKKADTLMTSMWVNNDTAHCFLLFLSLSRHMWGIITNLEYLLFFWIYLLNKSQTFFTHSQKHQFFFFSWKLSALRQDNNFFFHEFWRREKFQFFLFGEQLLGLEVVTQSSKEDELKQMQSEKFHDWATKRLSEFWADAFPEKSLFITYDTLWYIY